MRPFRAAAAAVAAVCLSALVVSPAYAHQDGASTHHCTTVDDPGFDAAQAMRVAVPLDARPLTTLRVWVNDGVTLGAVSVADDLWQSRVLRSGGATAEGDPRTGPGVLVLWVGVTAARYGVADVQLDVSVMYADGGSVWVPLPAASVTAPAAAPPAPQPVRWKPCPPAGTGTRGGRERHVPGWWPIVPPLFVLVLRGVVRRRSRR